MKSITRSVFSGRHAFTLIELLTVIAIVGILSAIVIPLVGRARANAKNAQCSANLRQLALAAQMHAGEKRIYPSTRDANTWCDQSVLKDTNAFWIEQLAPYLAGTAQAANDNRVCPSYAENQTPNYYRAGYALNRRPLLAEANDATDISILRPGMIQNPARTILILETTDWHSNGYNVAGLPANWVGDRHGSHANYAFADGSVRSLAAREALPLLMRPGTVPAAYQ